jgi:hypothetical protein
MVMVLGAVKICYCDSVDCGAIGGDGGSVMVVNSVLAALTLFLPVLLESDVMLKCFWRYLLECWYWRVGANGGVLGGEDVNGVGEHDSSGIVYYSSC